MANEELKFKFHLFYFSRPWPQFEATLLAACEEAARVEKIHSGVKLIKADDGEINFREILNLDLPAEKVRHIKRADDIE